MGIRRKNIKYKDLFARQKKYNLGGPVFTDPKKTPKDIQTLRTLQYKGRIV